MAALCTGRQADGRIHTPHEYGAVILLTNMAEDVVPADQVAPLREAVHQFLHASHVDMFDKAQAAIDFQKARDLEAGLAPEARAFMHMVNERDALGLGARLLPFLDRWGQEAALSPVSHRRRGRRCSSCTRRATTSIPDSEATALGDYLRSQGTPVRVHVTSLMSHAEVARAPTPGELVTLVRMWAELPW